VSKKRVRRAPRYKAKKGAAVPLAESFDRVDLKPIGAAFDQVLEHLDHIKKVAIDPPAVKKTIKRLERLQTAVANSCPQFWFEPFAIQGRRYRG